MLIFKTKTGTILSKNGISYMMASLSILIFLGAGWVWLQSRMGINAVPKTVIGSIGESLICVIVIPAILVVCLSCVAVACVCFEKVFSKQFKQDVIQWLVKTD